MSISRPGVPIECLYITRRMQTGVGCFCCGVYCRKSLQESVGAAPRPSAAGHLRFRRRHRIRPLGLRTRGFRRRLLRRLVACAQAAVITSARKRDGVLESSEALSMKSHPTCVQHPRSAPKCLENSAQPVALPICAACPYSSLGVPPACSWRELRGGGSSASPMRGFAGPAASVTTLLRPAAW